MITKEELNSIGYRSTNETEYYDLGTCDYLFNIKTQELFYIEDGMCNDFMCRVTDFEKLKEFIKIA